MDLAGLFNDHAQDLRRFLASRVACQATAADLTQEVFFQLARMPELERVENFRTYLFRIVTNLATYHLRARARRQTAMPNPEKPQRFIPMFWG